LRAKLPRNEAKEDNLCDAWITSIWTQLDIKQLNSLVKERESWRKLSHRDEQSAIGGESG